jgi:uncharacterized protein with PQ loop repeat
MNPALMHAIGEGFGLAGGSLSTVVALPQVFRIRKLGHSDGVSLLPYLLLCVTFSAWFTYGVILGSPALIISNVLTYTTGALVIVSIRGNRISSYAIMAAISAATISFVHFSPDIVVRSLLVMLTFARLPQLIVSWKNRNLETATAVSLGSLLMNLLGSSLWMAYSVLTERPFFILTTSLAISIALSTFVIEWRISSRARTQLVAD